MAHLARADRTRSTPRSARSAAAPLRRIAVLLGVGLLAACGDTTEDPPEAGAGAGCEAEGATVAVEIPDFAFDPTPVEVDRCDAVVWSNSHDQPHTSTGQGDQRWSTGNLAPGDRSEPVRFETAGTFSYICALHPFMEGTVTVR